MWRETEPSVPYDVPSHTQRRVSKVESISLSLLQSGMQFVQWLRSITAVTNVKGDGCLSDLNVINSLGVQHNKHVYRKEVMMFPNEMIKI